jgi:hypothetical protein
MKVAHYLAHLVRQHRSREPVASQTVRDEIRKTLSKDNFTATLKKRLVAEHKRRTLIEQLQTLEEELAALRDVQRERVRVLHARVERLKKKI